MRKDKRSKVFTINFTVKSVRLISFSWLAVTLEGTVIHKSGLITGGRSTHNMSKKWNEKDIDGDSHCRLDKT
jgi:chromosome segregation ATPase